MMYGMIDAIYALRPGVKGFSIKGDDYSGLEWKNDTHTKPTEEEINQKIAELNEGAAHKALRIERDRRLTACDWVVTKHTEHGKMVPEDWKIYRQALRDLPNISYRPELDDRGQLKMDSVAWPTPPE